jgi:chromosome segregation ATPase
VGGAVEIYEAARRQLAEAEEELEGIRHRTEELKASTMEAVVGSSDAGELGEEISEVQEELRDLTQAEKSAQRRKEDAEETLRRVGVDFEGDLGLAADEVAALALSKVEEIDAFKARLDQRFAEGRMSILGAAT